MPIIRLTPSTTEQRHIPTIPTPATTIPINRPLTEIPHNAPTRPVRTRPNAYHRRRNCRRDGRNSNRERRRESHRGARRWRGQTAHRDSRRVDLETVISAVNELCDALPARVLDAVVVRLEGIVLALVVGGLRGSALRDVLRGHALL